jgi:hypothetical protein
MALLRLQIEADCLTSQLTKQSLKHQPSSNPQSKLSLPRERFSPRVDTGPLVFSKADIRTAWQIVARKRLLKNSKRNGLFPVPRFIPYGAPIAFRTENSLLG